MTRLAHWMLCIGAGALVAAVLLVALPLLGTVWPEVREFLVVHSPVLALGLLGGAGLITGAALLLRSRAPVAVPRVPWLLTDKAIAVVTATVATLGVVTMLVLLAVAGGAPGGQRAELRIDAIKYGLGAVASGAALAALLLALRRQRLAEQAQRHVERAQAHTEMDAAERRITELYVTAADQLGSAKEPVRLTGLYALERLAQDNQAHRQTIVEVLCAYLRMPLHPPSRTADAGSGAATARATEPDGADPGSTSQDEVAVASSFGDRQVRLTVQRILVRHLRLATRAHHNDAQADPLFWADIDLDLTEASLERFDFTGCRPRSVTFADATFIGDARFDRAHFAGDAIFHGARFTGDARFGGVSFHGTAGFDHAMFVGDARFGGAKFFGDAWFSTATFTGSAWFRGTTFTGAALFNGATFTVASFGDAIFNGNAGFREAAIGRSVKAFEGARVIPRPDRSDVWPPWLEVDADSRLVRTARTLRRGASAGTSADA